MASLTLAQWATVATLVVALFGILTNLKVIGQWLRKQWRYFRDGVDSEKGWETPNKARTRFTECAPLEAWITARQQAADARMALDDATSKLGTINVQMPREEANALSERVQVVGAECRIANRRSEAAEAAAREAFLGTLSSGELIAKGYVLPHKAGAKAMAIPKDEWQFLELFDHAEEAAGGGLRYFRVRIRKR